VAHAGRTLAGSTPSRPRPPSGTPLALVMRSDSDAGGGAPEWWRLLGIRRGTAAARSWPVAPPLLPLLGAAEAVAARPCEADEEEAVEVAAW